MRLKTDLAKTFQSAAAGLLMALSGSDSFAATTTPAPDSNLSISPGTNGNIASLTISNAGNQVWVIQNSTNLANWTEVES